MTPTMTYAHLLFAVATAAYILIAIQFEERDLIREYGNTYEEYRRRVPMLVPFTRRSAAPVAAERIAGDRLGVQSADPAIPATDPR